MCTQGHLETLLSFDYFYWINFLTTQEYGMVRDGEGEDHRVPEPDRADSLLFSTFLLIPLVSESLDFSKHSLVQVSLDLLSFNLSSGKLFFLPLPLDNSYTFFKYQFIGVFSHSTSLLFSPSRQPGCSCDHWSLSSHFKPWDRRKNYGWQNYKKEPGSLNLS